MNITVYLGANEGNDPALKQAVRELGTWIGESGHDLIYGGSKVGLRRVCCVQAAKSRVSNRNFLWKKSCNTMR